MRGKKFLDAYVVNTISTPKKGTPGSSDPALEESTTLLAASIFGFGFLGPASQESGGYLSPGGSSGAVAMAAKAGISPKGGSNSSSAAGGTSKQFGEIQLVQDSAFLLLVQRIEVGEYPTSRVSDLNCCCATI